MNPVIVSCGWDKVVKVCNPHSLRFFIPRERSDVTYNICYFRGIHIPMRLQYITKISDPLTFIRHISVTPFSDNFVTYRFGSCRSSS